MRGSRDLHTAGPRSERGASVRQVPVKSSVGFPAQAGLLRLSGMCDWPRNAFAVIASLLISLNSVAVLLCREKDGAYGLYFCATYAKSVGRVTNVQMAGQRPRGWSCQYFEFHTSYCDWLVGEPETCCHWGAFPDCQGEHLDPNGHGKITVQNPEQAADRMQQCDPPIPDLPNP